MSKRVELLVPDYQPDAEAVQITKILEKAKLPRWVVRLLHLFDIDSSGEAAVWIWVIVQDQVADQSTFFEQSEEVREALVGALRRQGVRRWPYIRFRTESEQQTVQAASKR